MSVIGRLSKLNRRLIASITFKFTTVGMKEINKITWSAIFIAIAIVLPIIFHMVGLGSMFSPMHIPVLLAGFIVGPVYGLIVGVVSPLLSGLITGMPPFAPPYAIVMAFELGAYGFLAGLFYQKLRMNEWFSLILSMLGGRIVYGLVAYVLMSVFGILKFDLLAYVTTGIISAWPAMLVQIAIIPTLVFALRKNNLVKQG